ncbi:flagellar hook-length control protein FliK [Parasedimentitalea huanghaiensis]|uniref:Flagellar hook-length control protein-like C-terminal domain-containing protein n=1 Tax=Parasedimentitalea huanghaiensis TaxID=2682100 RepID=A0A6L6WD00_9RHOB|nr:flagellar hook-length control protein FliK [Zongyanglinia huanghaiensis]MVO15584.1 hypothetical protein [Zongyanglinia huanghaiensis]
MLKHIQSGTAFDVVKSSVAPKSNSASTGADFQNYYSKTEKDQTITGDEVQPEALDPETGLPITPKIDETADSPKGDGAGASDLAESKSDADDTGAEGSESAVPFVATQEHSPSAVARSASASALAVEAGKQPDTAGDTTSKGLGTVQTAATSTPAPASVAGSGSDEGDAVEPKPEQVVRQDATRQSGHRSIAELQLATAQSATNAHQAEKPNVAAEQQQQNMDRIRNRLVQERPTATVNSAQQTGEVRSFPTITKNSDTVETESPRQRRFAQSADGVEVTTGDKSSRQPTAPTNIVVTQNAVAAQPSIAGQAAISDAEVLLDHFNKNLMLDPLSSEPAGLSQLLTEAVMSPGTAHRPETPRLVAAQLATALATKGERNIDVALNPEELGRVKMRVTTTDSSVIVMITTERPETGDMMRRHINELADEFRQMGFEDISFEFGGEGFAGQMGEGAEQGASFGGGSSEASDTDPLANNIPEPAQKNLRLGETGLDMRI